MVCGHGCWCGVELFGEQLEGAGHSWAVGPVEGDGDRRGGVVDVASEMKQVARDGPVFVGVGQVGVEVFGQPRFGVERPFARCGRSVISSRNAVAPNSQTRRLERRGGTLETCRRPGCGRSRPDRPKAPTGTSAPVVLGRQQPRQRLIQRSKKASMRPGPSRSQIACDASGTGSRRARWTRR